MVNNEILRRIRDTFDLSDSKIIDIFSLANLEITPVQINDWLKAEDDSAYQTCEDVHLAAFLNGFINEKRGKKEGAQPEPEKRLTNNIIFKKLKIALDLKDEDIFSIMDLADFTISKPELSSIFRKKGNKNYRACKDEVLDKFLMGVHLSNAK